MKTMINIALLIIWSSLSSAQGVNEKNNNPLNIKKVNIMENQATQVVNAFLTAVQKGDTEKLALLLHPEIEWDQPGNNRFSGIKTSVTEVFQMVGGMFEISAGSLALTDIKVIAVNGNSVAALIHWKAVHPAGTVLNVDNIDVYTVENGKIVQAKIYTTDAAQEDNFWGR